VSNCLFADRSCPAVPDRARNICFLAAACAPAVQPRIDQIVTAAEDLGLTCMVAERRQKFSREVFCEKICKPIVESRFCIVLLDESRRRPKWRPAPNANVYLEYGMMLVREKLVVAFTPRGQDIRFNIRHLDLVEYEAAGLHALAAAKFTQALADTEKRYVAPRRAPKRAPVMAPTMVRSARRVLEMSGMRPCVPGVAGATAADGTAFEPWFSDGELLLLGYLPEGGASLAELVKEARWVADRLGKAWDKARSWAAARNASVASRFRTGGPSDAETDKVRLSRSRLLIVTDAPEGDLAEARRSLGGGVAAAFGPLPIEIWSVQDLADAERRVGLSD
jgi:hypothetical protein